MVSLINSAQPEFKGLLSAKLIRSRPKSDHRCSPSYYSEEDFEQRREKSSVSPTFKPGNISDYVPGQSSISQHERNLVSFGSKPGRDWQTFQLSNAISRTNCLSSARTRISTISLSTTSTAFSARSCSTRPLARLTRSRLSNATRLDERIVRYASYNPLSLSLSPDRSL